MYCFIERYKLYLELSNLVLRNKIGFISLEIYFRADNLVKKIDKSKYLF